MAYMDYDNTFWLIIWGEAYRAGLISCTDCTADRPCAFHGEALRLA